MGSGRGQSRRALTTTTAATAEVEFDVAEWTAFVDGQGIGNVRLVDYYDVKFPPGNNTLLVVAPQTIELATEFFQDLVGVGAITLPAGVDADGFEFDARMVKPHDRANYEVAMLTIKNKQTGRETQCLRTPWNALNSKITLSSRALEGLVRSMG